MTALAKHKPKENAGVIEMEKIITAMYLKGAITKDQIRELAESLAELARQLPDNAKELH